MSLSISANGVRALDSNKYEIECGLIPPSTQ